MKEELVKIVNEVKGVVEECDLRGVTERDIFEMATEIFISREAEKGKDKRNQH